ncbi:hypothetical protein BN946_scf184657.g27 [Trametes cinnabarina]|uniref:Uncharacterized protein n=1 Tax=Pycnoporus cinnabarinus TaxID=5643 RepID=A0A060SRH0_PYCCI|nr:hypothetical protein BN946_scf184657.g27 [Trametes cinnabarina]
MESAAILSHVLRVYYPCLKELTIRGRCTLKQLSHHLTTPAAHDDVHCDEDEQTSSRIPDGEDATSPTWPSIPTLRRLHLACTFQGLSHGTHSEHSLINGLAPALTHLRLSVLDLWGSKNIAGILHAECADLGIVDPSLECAPSSLLLPSSSPPLSNNSAQQAPDAPDSSIRISSLRFPHLTFPTTARSRLEHGAPSPRKASRVTWNRIIPDTGVLQIFAFQPAPTELSGFYCSCCMDVRGDQDVMHVFEALARHSDERFLYIPCRKKSGYDFEDAQTDWLERVHGLMGCWASRRGNEAHEVAVEAGGSQLDEEQALDHRIHGKNRPSFVLRSAVRQLRKARFW